MSLVVSNPDLLQHASDERGIVTLLQQISGQFVSCFGRAEILRSVAPHEVRNALVTHCAKRLFLVAGVLANGASGDVVIDAGGDQLAADAQLADVLQQSRADVCGGEAIVIDPLLGFQPRDGLIDDVALELLRPQLPPQLPLGIEAITEDTKRREIAAIEVGHGSILTCGAGILPALWAGERRQDPAATRSYNEFPKSNGDSSLNGSLSVAIDSFDSISSFDMSAVDWMPCSLVRNSSGFDARRSAWTSVINPFL